jgi:hypothetical protein
MSLLTAMSQKESYLFSSQFWNTQSISNDKKNKHRDIEIYHIKLTLEGYLFLKQQLQSNEHLVWLSIDEVVEGKSTDGKIAYVNALINNFDMDKHELKTELFKIQESFIANYSYQPQKPNDYALTIPIISESSILFGFKGKEKSIDVKLSERQLSILLGLSSHSRRFEFEFPI